MKQHIQQVNLKNAFSVIFSLLFLYTVPQEQNLSVQEKVIQRIMVTSMVKIIAYIFPNCIA